MKGKALEVTEHELGEWILAFCTALDNHDGKHSLLDHLRHANRQQSNPEFCHVLENVYESAAQGYPLSHAFSQHPDVFTEAFVTTVRYGEIYGEVDITLRRYVERPEDRAAKCGLPEQPAV